MPHDTPPRGVPRRRALRALLRRGIRRPVRALAFAGRLLRNRWLLRSAHGDHLAFRRAVVRADARRTAGTAASATVRERQDALGELQFSYLRSHGLLPVHHLLEIGCGSLSAGWRFVDYLAPGHYHGVDIAPEALYAAQRMLAVRGLQDKVPYLSLVDDLRFAQLPAGHFDVAHAHDVFTHAPPQLIVECLAHVRRVLKPGGFFDFTYHRAEERESTGRRRRAGQADAYDALREHFRYRAGTLIGFAGAQGLLARTMDDWDALPHGQSRIRVVVPRSHLPEGE
ncbi:MULTISPECIES: class I SAM-dependent methyltransferase [Streptomyces]|uniref:Methyltransferase n=1 Tax=Streptomyces cacaoi TaxID=1898 RepID=A0A4Y3R349_STRCI|nr:MULTISPECIES: class I SAM-dependent methyltransferase [Streptomyces]NNG87308.1 class I SAM-dependent methyltransferase [Streptomyces cacaoi]QHF94061.1 class I SAM-dependent methyltransferase [Streptomyces sp. NHF165]GEB51719.1 methyltransferase [Streptomyces cacaoi]